MKANVLLALSPLLVISLGGLLLMVVEALSHRREESDTRSSGPSSDMAMGTAVTLFAGAVFSAALWMYGPDRLEGAAQALAPFLMVDRFTLFFTFVL
jgi:NADH-quinone oxidoreductase subunit N